MGVLEFLCDIRFHRNLILTPNPETGRDKPYRVSYADYGDPNSNAVVLFCGALMGTRFCYSPLDQLAKAYSVRIIHPDRPGIGGSDSVELENRVQVWLEMVPQLLAHLNIPFVSLASHSGGDVYLFNTIITFPHLLHPQNPYVCFFAPWVHPSHSKVTHMRATSLLPAPMIGKFASVAKFINENVTPLGELSGSFVQGIKGSLLRSNPPPSPVPLKPFATRSRAPSICSQERTYDLALDDPDVVDELRRCITTFFFAESMEGISADAQLFLRKPRSIPWCSRSLFWSDIDYAVLLLSKIISEDDRLIGNSRTWLIDTFHAEDDDMVGERGRQWFDECWSLDRSSTSIIPSASSQFTQQQPRKSYEYRSRIVKDTDHNYLMDPAYGASELWLKRVREAFPLSAEVQSENDALITSTSPISDGKKKTFRLFLDRLRHMTRSAAVRRPLPQSDLSQNMLIVSSRSGRECSSADDEIALFQPPAPRQKTRIETMELER